MSVRSRGGSNPYASFDGVAVDVANETGKTPTSPDALSLRLDRASEEVSRRGPRRGCWGTCCLVFWTAVLALLVGGGIGAGITIGVLEPKVLSFCTDQLPGANASAAAPPAADQPDEPVIEPVAVASQIEPATHSDFKLMSGQYFPDFDVTVHEFEHVATGAKVMSVITDDINKHASIIAKTPADDNKGAAHILLHALLMGSENYPTKSPPPFERMQQGSLYTYMNGFVGEDFTEFPVASATLQDYRNLVDVYMDGVFNPLVVTDERVMKFEGWRVTLYNASHPASVDLDGVVLNKLKNAASNPSSRLQHLLRQNLYPDTAYANIILGELLELPTLTHEELVEFYHSRYHPSNTHLWFYGDDDEAERLDRLSAVLDGYEKIDTTHTEIKDQPMFDTPRKVVGEYPGTVDDGAYVTSAWMVSGPDGIPTRERLAWTVLMHLLDGTAESALWKPLLDSGLGSPIITLDRDFKQPMFRVGFANVNATDEEAPEAAFAAVMDSLAAIVAVGFSPEDVEAALNTVEIDFRQTLAETTTLGAAILDQLVSDWVHGRNVFESLHFNQHFAFLREIVAAGEPVFTNLLRLRVLENAHRVDLVMSPSDLVEMKEKSELEAILMSFVEGKNGWELKEMVEETEAIDAWKAEPDSLAAVASIPVLDASSIDPQVQRFQQSVLSVMGTSLATPPVVLFNTQPTAGLLYAKLAINITSDISEDNVHYLPLLKLAMRFLGTQATPAAKLEQRISNLTGGLSIDFNVDAPVSGPYRDVPFVFLQISTSCRAENMEETFALILEMLEKPALFSEDAGENMEDFVTLLSNAVKSSLKANSYLTTIKRAVAQLRPEGWIDEKLTGVSNMLDLQKWEAALAKPGGWESLRDTLAQMLGTIIAEPRAILSLTGDKTTVVAAHGPAMGVMGTLELAAAKAKALAGPQHGQWNTTLPTQHEAILIGPGMNSLAYVTDLSKLGYTFQGSADVAARLLQDVYLWNNVRTIGGAYGAYVTMHFDGRVAFYSAYDPNLHETVKVFDEAPAWIHEMGTSMEPMALNNAIISAIRTYYPYLSPVSRGNTAYTDYITEVTYSLLDQWKGELLATTSSDLTAFAAMLEAADFSLVAAIPESSFNQLQNQTGQLQFASVVDELIA